MTKDFRNVGRIPTPPATDPQAPDKARDGIPVQNQRIIIGVIYLMSIGFLVAGVWLLTGGASPFPKETAFFLGIGLVIGGMADIAAAQFIKRAWRKKSENSSMSI